MSSSIGAALLLECSCVVAQVSHSIPMQLLRALRTDPARSLRSDEVVNVDLFMVLTIAHFWYGQRGGLLAFQIAFTQAIGRSRIVTVTGCSLSNRVRPKPSISRV